MLSIDVNMTAPWQRQSRLDRTYTLYEDLPTVNAVNAVEQTYPSLK
jgi:hypothetical protein